VPDRLRAVVIGAGQAGEGHTIALQHVGVDVTSICSRTPSVVAEVARRLGVKRASVDWRKTLEMERPDIVDIATPASAHVEQITAALESGCHVYADKPLAVAADDARALYQLSRKKGLRTAIAATWMYDPGIVYLAELVAAGSIGKPLAVESRFVSPWPYPGTAIWINYFAQGGGVLNNRLSHQLAAAQRIVGGEVLQVAGEARLHRGQRPRAGQLHDYRAWRALSPEELEHVPWVNVDADDSCTVLVRLGQPGAKPEDTITANIYCASTIRARDGRSITVYGEDGSLHYDWVVDPRTNAVRDGHPYVCRAGFPSGEWQDEPVPESVIRRLPHIVHSLHRDWAALAREFVADIQGEPHEAYPTFRQGWIYQEITETIRDGAGWTAIPQDLVADGDQPAFR
jgi:predicted dehydrogenase